MEAGGELAIHERRFRGRQDRLLFAYLVSERVRPIPREELAAILWSEETPPAWQTALSALVSRLRRLIARPELRDRGVSISQSFGQYQLHLPPDTWVDTEAATHAIDRAEGALRLADAKAAFGPATVAATIAGRPFLSGHDGPWASSQRGKLERLRVRALECLACVWIESGEPALAVEAAADALALDPFRESAHRLLMRAHTLGGNRAEAIRSYHRLRDLLVSELGADPSKETEAAYLELLR